MVTMVNDLLDLSLHNYETVRSWALFLSLDFLICDIAATNFIRILPSTFAIHSNSGTAVYIMDLLLLLSIFEYEHHTCGYWFVHSSLFAWHWSWPHCINEVLIKGLCGYVVMTYFNLLWCFHFSKFFWYRYAGRSLTKLLKRWPSLISSCVLILTENLRDSKAPEHVVLGSCSILSSHTVLRHLTTVCLFQTSYTL